MPANRMNRDEFYAAMAQSDDARLRKILWTVYWRGNAQVRERIEDELRPADRPIPRFCCLIWSALSAAAPWAG